jgi:HK97 family phage major capsid protein
MWHDSTLKALKLLVDAQNRPLWQPGLTASFREGAGVTLDKPVVLNHPYVINQDMPPMAANATSILFGDMSKYLVREVAGGITMRRLLERYADNLQEGFFGYMRLDGQLVDAGTHPIAVGKNSAT